MVAVLGADKAGLTLAVITTTSPLTKISQSEMKVLFSDTATGGGGC